MTRLIRFLMVLALLALADKSFGQSHNRAHDTVKRSVPAPELRRFDRQALNKYAADPAFQYKDGSNMDNSVWDRFWSWVWSLVRAVGKHMPPGSFFKYFFIVLAAAAVLFFVLKLLGMDPIQIISGRPKMVEVPYDESLENIHEINFDEQIERAVVSHNYRLAVRLMYLKCLKNMNDSNIIHWQPDKSNAVYISEIQHSAQQEAFKALTRKFEYIWYGNFPLNSSGFASISSSFHEFNKLGA